MEKVLRPYDKERMRLAMLKHEETFREQVNELHRLYRIQKMLMDKNQHQQQQQAPRDNVVLSATKLMSETKSKMMLDENEIELTLSLGPSTQNPRRQKPEPTESGRTQSFSSSSTGSSQARKTSPKGRSSIATKTTRGDAQFTWDDGTGIGSTFPHGSEPELKPKPGFSNGQQNNPPWLFHALSLKLS